MLCFWRGLAAFVAVLFASCDGTCIDYTQYYRCACTDPLPDGGTSSNTRYSCARDLTQAVEETEQCAIASCRKSCSCTVEASDCPNSSKARCH